MDINEKTPRPEGPNCSMAAVDLNSIMPFYTCFDAGKICRQGKFASKLLYQEATSESEDAPLSYSCSNSKYIVHNKTTKTISVQSIFDSSLHHDLDAKDNAEVVNKACADFAHIIKAQLNTQKMYLRYGRCRRRFLAIGECVQAQPECRVCTCRNSATKHCCGLLQFRRDKEPIQGWGQDCCTEFV